MHKVSYILPLGVEESLELTVCQERDLRSSYYMELTDVGLPPIGYTVTGIVCGGNHLMGVSLAIRSASYFLTEDRWVIKLERHLCKTPEGLEALKKSLEKAGWKGTLDE